MREVVLDHDVTLTYCERGAGGGPTVVLLPGPTDSWRSYQPVLESLPEGVRAIAVSLRGHGDSSKPPSGYRIEDLAFDVVPFLDALDIPTTVLVGHSGSCLVARRVALDNPQRVAGLVLEASPTTLRGDAALVRFVDTVLAELTDPVDHEFARSVIVGTSTEHLASELEEQLVDDLVKLPVAAWRQMFASLLDYDDTSDLSALHGPALLIWGDADQLVPRSMQEQLLHRLVQAELIVYPGAGHTPRWEQPQRFAQNVAEFASRHCS